MHAYTYVCNQPWAAHFLAPDWDRAKGSLWFLCGAVLR